VLCTRCSSANPCEHTLMLAWRFAMPSPTCNGRVVAHPTGDDECVRVGKFGRVASALQKPDQRFERVGVLFAAGLVGGSLFARQPRGEPRRRSAVACSWCVNRVSGWCISSSAFMPEHSRAA